MLRLIMWKRLYCFMKILPNTLILLPNRAGKAIEFKKWLSKRAYRGTPISWTHMETLSFKVRQHLTKFLRCGKLDLGFSG